MIRIVFFGVAFLQPWTEKMHLRQTQRRGGMDKKELKKLVTSLGLAGLMAGVTVTMSAGPAIGGSG